MKYAKNSAKFTFFFFFQSRKSTVKMFGSSLMTERVCVNKTKSPSSGRFYNDVLVLLTPPPSSGAHRRHLFFPSLSPLSKAREEDKERRRSLVTWFRFLFCKKENQAISVSNSFFVREIISFAKMIWSPTSKVSVFFFIQRRPLVFFFTGNSAD